MAQAKWCVRCTQPGHLSHACSQPNPLMFPRDVWVPQMPQIAVTYRSNYNDCDLYINVNSRLTHMASIDEYSVKAVRVCDVIAVHASKDCDIDGKFHGDLQELERFAIKTVKEIFGRGAVDVTFTVDAWTT